MSQMLTAAAIIAVIVAALQWRFNYDSRPAIFAVLVIGLAIFMHRHVTDEEQRIEHAEPTDGRYASMHNSTRDDQDEFDALIAEQRAKRDAETAKRTRRRWPIIGLAFQTWDWLID